MTPITDREAITGSMWECVPVAKCRQLEEMANELAAALRCSVSEPSRGLAALAKFEALKTKL